MTISLSPEAQRVIEEEMRLGGHRTLEDAVMAGIHALQERREEALSAAEIDELREEIRVGVEQADRGELHEGEAVFQRLGERLEERRGQQ